MPARSDEPGGEGTPRARRRPWRSVLALMPVAGSCVVSLVLLRAQLTQVPYLNDDSVAEEMVRFALEKIRSGHFPPDSWFPYLNLGSPQFLHYQSLAALLVALLAWAIGVGRAFTLTTWLLIACWPLCIYAAARVFGLSRGAAAAAATLSPFVSSAPRVGFEQISYLWIGYGLWSQLFAMWTLPFAWAFSWRAVDERRFVVPAAAAIAATAAFHFEMGYLAFLAVPVFVVVRAGRFRARLWRGLLVAAAAAALDAWVIVPLVAQGKWAAVNQFLQTGPESADANSYGAGRVLSWLFGGNLLDWHHLPLLTPLLLLGLLSCLWCWRRPSPPAFPDAGVGRALVLVFCCTLVLFFGRPTLGSLLVLLPGERDLFLRRFVAGVQLSGLLLAGVGAARLAGWVVALTRRGSHLLGAAAARRAAPVGVAVVACLSLAVLVPAWSFVVDQADLNARYVSQQTAAGTARQLDSLLADITRSGGGRTYAGTPSNWGADFTVGDVPVYEYLASDDVDEVGFTLRTASLMSDPEVDFDESNPADFATFGIRFLIFPFGSKPSVRASVVASEGNFVLWEIPDSGYVQVVDTRGTIAANSADLASFAGPFLSGSKSAVPIYPTVAYEGAAAAEATLPAGVEPSGPPGRVVRVHTDLVDGSLVARVVVVRTAVVLLSASYDPGWRVTVDGRPVATEMVAPALTGVRVDPGVHTVRFFYQGFPDYAQMFTIGVATLVALVALEWRRRAKAHRATL